MSNISDSINIVLTRFGEFLNVFDLSFFLSGLTGMAAIILWLIYNQVLRYAEITGMAAMTALVVASYILGLICFAIGRWIRKDLLKKGRNREFIKEALLAHGLDEFEPFRGYLERNSKDGLNHLYARMWAVVRQKHECSNSLSLLNRYWVIAAAYDGLAVALVLWVADILYFACNPLTWFALSPVIALAACLFLLLAIRICLREGYRSECHLIEELVATVAALEPVSMGAEAIESFTNSKAG